MLNRSVLPRLLALLALLLGVGIASAQDAPAAPAAIRLRVAHLAPFTGSDNATIRVQIDGVAVGGTLSYGDHTPYLPLTGAPGPRTVQVFRDGNPVLPVEPPVTVTLADGDNSLVVIGDAAQVPLDVLALDDNLADPQAGKAGLRVAHVAAIGTTIEATQVDVCSQAGELFHSTAAGLRYKRATAYRIINAATYNLKVTRFNEANPCSGAIVITPPPIILADGTETTLYLVGDGTNQSLGAFTFEDGLLGDDSPVDSELYLPTVFAD